jgi:hypothetical protein
MVSNRNFNEELFMISGQCSELDNLIRAKIILNHIDRITFPKFVVKFAKVGMKKKYDVGLILSDDADL